MTEGNAPGPVEAEGPLDPPFEAEPEGQQQPQAPVNEGASTAEQVGESSPDQPVDQTVAEPAQPEENTLKPADLVRAPGESEWQFKKRERVWKLETTPIEKRSALDQLKLRAADSNPDTKIDSEVNGLLLLMEKYGVLKNGQQVEALAGKTKAEIENSDEYLQMKMRNVADEKNRPDMMGSEYVEKMIPELNKIRQETEGLTIEQAMEKIQLAEQSKIEGEIAKRLIDEEEAINGSVEESVKSEIRAAAKEQAAVEAKSRQDRWLAHAKLMMGEYVTSSIDESSFNDFLDNFLSSGIHRGGSWGRNRQFISSELPNGKKMVEQGEVEQHFKSKEKVVETVMLFYEKAQENDKLNLSEFQVLEHKSASEFKEISNEDLEKMFQKLAKIMREGITNPDVGLVAIYEQALLKSMKKEPKENMLNEIVFLNVIAIGEHPKAFKEFSDKFIDVPKAT